MGVVSCIYQSTLLSNIANSMVPERLQYLDSEQQQRYCFKLSFTVQVKEIASVFFFKELQYFSILCMVV